MFTGSIFAVLTIVHALRIIEEWPHAMQDPTFLWTMTSMTLLTGVLSVWAWRVLRQIPTR
jgi:hypothetical protein